MVKREVRTLRSVALRSLSNGDGHNGWLVNGPDVRSENRRAEAKGKTPPPIEVEPRGGGRYKIRDGHDRVHFAKQRGDTHIQAWVITEEDDGQPVKKRPFFHWT